MKAETTIQRAQRLSSDLLDLKSESEGLTIITSGFQSKLSDVANNSKYLVQELIAIFEEVPEFKAFIIKQRDRGV